jgi:hypothetical protein
LALILLPIVSAGALATAVGTSLNDFFQPGTQPQTLTVPIDSAQTCSACHGSFDYDTEPLSRWSASMMAQSARDPMFHACLAIAEQDAPASGDLCIRCHSPGGWLEGRSTPTDGSALQAQDFEGVTCHVCHRMVDPIYDSVANPYEDSWILAALTNPPAADAALVGSGQFVIDPDDRRRGPYDLGLFFGWHEFRQSPFHRESTLCGTCHDVSNPAYSRQGGSAPAAADTYALNALGAPHPTQHKYDQFPLERTYSEWRMSAFAQGPVDLGGLFGNQQAVSTCQDCHMPKIDGSSCAPFLSPDYHTDLGQHDFNGANSWVLNAVRQLDLTHQLYPPGAESGLTQAEVDLALARNRSMLERSCQVTLSTQGDALAVRITNNSGHKLPTGYTEGRRMWINVRFLDASGALVAERGAYDAATAVLTAAGTKVYEAELGLDAAVAAATALPAGPSFHFALVNQVYKDNRIPPRGFTNAGFESVQAAPVAASYADGQYWDDTLFQVPCGALSATVTVYHQTTSKEYVEFLRDANTTNNRGQIAYDLWVANGKSAPVAMQTATLAFGPRLSGDNSSVSLSAGGAQHLCLTAGPAHAGRLYLLLGSTAGSVPGLWAGSLHVPLNYDAYFAFTLGNPNQSPLAGSLGWTNASGAAAATFTLPPSSSSALIGLAVAHAAVLIELPTLAPLAATNSVTVQLVP